MSYYKCIIPDHYKRIGNPKQGEKYNTARDFGFKWVIREAVLWGCCVIRSQMWVQ